MVICLEQGADLHTAQLMPLPLTVSCFSKIQIGFAFLVPAHPGSPRQRAVKRVCVVGERSTFFTENTQKPPFHFLPTGLLSVLLGVFRRSQFIISTLFCDAIHAWAY